MPLNISPIESIEWCVYQSHYAYVVLPTFPMLPSMFRSLRFSLSRFTKRQVPTACCSCIYFWFMWLLPFAFSRFFTTVRALQRTSSSPTTRKRKRRRPLPPRSKLKHVTRRRRPRPRATTHGTTGRRRGDRRGNPWCTSSFLTRWRWDVGFSACQRCEQAYVFVRVDRGDD